MTADIYDQHARAFARVEAYAILRDGRPARRRVLRRGRGLMRALLLDMLGALALFVILWGALWFAPC